MKKLLAIFFAAVVIVAGFVLGRATGNGDSAEPVSLLNAVKREIPLFPAPPKPDDVPITEPLPEKDVIVESPLDGERPLESTFEVAGRAKAGNVAVTLTSDSGTPLFAQTVTIAAPEGEYGRFSVTVTLAETPTAPVTLTVAGADGTPDVRRLAYGGANETTISVFVTDGGFRNGASCEAVRPVPRVIPFNVSAYRAAIELLLEGPTDAEVREGAVTAVPSGATLKSVGADAQGTVTADFDDRLLRGVRDDCRRAAIRAQIEATVRQFPEARDVRVTVNGEPLEPQSDEN